METIEIQVSGLGEEAVKAILESNDSGFEVVQQDESYDFHTPLNSEIGDIVGILGFVISATRLAIDLVRMQKVKNDGIVPSSSEKTVEIQVISPTGQIKITGKSIEEIEAILREYQA